MVVKTLAEQKRFDAVIALGAVIRGETPHFDYVAGECARRLSEIPLQTGVPVAFGVGSAVARSATSVSPPEPPTRLNETSPSFVNASRRQTFTKYDRAGSSESIDWAVTPRSVPP